MLSDGADAPRGNLNCPAPWFILPFPCSPKRSQGLQPTWWALQGLLGNPMAHWPLLVRQTPDNKNIRQDNTTQLFSQTYTRTITIQTLYHLTILHMPSTLFMEKNLAVMKALSKQHSKRNCSSMVEYLLGTCPKFNTQHLQLGLGKNTLHRSCQIRPTYGITHYKTAWYIHIKKSNVVLFKGDQLVSIWVRNCLDQYRISHSLQK